LNFVLLQLATHLVYRVFSGIGDMNMGNLFRHSGAGRNPVISTIFWIPACAGMTIKELTGQH
jgi:hypothetical protein